MRQYFAFKLCAIFRSFESEEIDAGASRVGEPSPFREPFKVGAGSIIIDWVVIVPGAGPVPVPTL